MPPSKKSDFDAEALTKKHDQDISTIFAWANRMEESFGTNEKIAKTLHSVAQTSVEMNTMLKECLIDLVQKDPDVKEEIKMRVDDVDRSAVWSAVKRASTVIGGIVLLIVGAVIGVVVQNLLGKK